MSVIILLIIASIIVAGGFLIAFLWAVKTGQFDDQHTPSMRILLDEKKSNQQTHNQINNTDAKNSPTKKVSVSRS